MINRRARIQSKNLGGATIFLQHKYNFNKTLYFTKNVIIVVGIGNINVMSKLLII